MRAVVEAERLCAGVPGCAVVVVRDGEVLLCEGFGERDLDRSLPVTPDTLFPIGSATKTFTAALVTSLGLDLDAPIGVALQSTDQLSFRDCLSHRSGLPRHDLLWQAGEGVLTRDDVVAALPHLPPSAGFRERYQYNNLLYLVAGHVAAGAAGGTYEGVLTERLLRPLGMTRSGFSVAELQRDPDHARPYLLDQVLKEIPYAALDLAGPAGGLNSCASDLVPWLLALTSGYGELRQPVVEMPARTPFEPLGYGLGLMLERYRGRVVAHHGGNIDGFSSQVLTRDDGVGIAVLANLHTTWLRDALPYLLLDLLDGMPSPDHGSVFASRLAASLVGIDRDPRQRWDGPAPDRSGTYRHAGYGDVLVDGLTWRYRGLGEGRLVPVGVDDYDARVWLFGSEQSLAARFEGDTLFLKVEQAIDPLPFVRSGS